jgi:hypothetical protein
MKKNVIGYCPICNDKLIAKTLRCDKCDTEITGEFNLSPFDYLSKEQLDFALVFIKCEGNIKAIEKNLNISYPTVKKNIDDLISALGMNNVTEINVEENNNYSREEVRKMLKNGEISFEEAEKLLGGL